MDAILTLSEAQEPNVPEAKQQQTAFDPRKKEASLKALKQHLEPVFSALNL